MPDEYALDQQQRIERDISSFTDPGTVVDVSPGGGRRFRATWTMRGASREATFTVSLDHGTSVAGGGRKQDYGAFLAGEQMANLRNVAEMIRQSSSQEFFVPTRARRTDLPSQKQELPPATDCLLDLAEEADADATRVIMVTGEAGSGKTKVLQELVSRQADRYVRGKTDKLFLYVNAQGRALARLNEALATELQDLRVSLTYHSVATLARVGILIPVIDGFDELLGVSGYDDAFNSLAQFLEQMDGQGCLVASARSVYYEEEFLSRAGRESATKGQVWSHVPVVIEDWGEQEREDFIGKIAEKADLSDDDREIFREQVDKVFRTQQALASKPLFVARTADLLVRSETDILDGGDDDLLGALTQAFLTREQREKLLDRQREPMLEIDQLNLLMCELAQEMWNQETRELDSGSVREVADYALATLKVSESVRQIVTERMPTLAFLTRSDVHGGITFEHEVFFIYFLALSIVDQYLGQDVDVRVMLSRSALPELAAERLAHHLKQRSMLGSRELEHVLRRLAHAGRTEWRRTTQVRENAGLIVLAVLGACAAESERHEIVGQTIASVVFPGGHLHDVTLRNCSLTSVEMRRTDLSRTKFIECNSSEDTLLIEPRVKKGDTKLDMGLGIAQVVGIQVLGKDANKTVYNPAAIEKIFAECGVSIESENGRRRIPEEHIYLLEELMHAYGRSNPVCEEDDNLKNLFTDSSWRAVRRVLLKHGVVTPEKRQTRGKKKNFLRRRFLPAEIMAGANRTRHVHHKIAGFWDELEATASHD